MMTIQNLTMHERILTCVSRGAGIALFIVVTAYTYRELPLLRGMGLFTIFLPSILLFILLLFSWVNKKIGGILYIFTSAGFIFIYNVYISFAVFLYAFYLGVLLLVSGFDEEMHRRFRRTVFWMPHDVRRGGVV